MADKNRENMPFDEDMMTLIMGIEPEAPGQHGRTEVPAPDKDAIGIIAQIKDLCEEFLLAADKGGEKAEKPSKDESKPSKKGEEPETPEMQEEEE